jgi:N-acetyl-anhydromuramyl-L-alanine amidase AmpD
MCSNNKVFKAFQFLLGLTLNDVDILVLPTKTLGKHLIDPSSIILHCIGLELYDALRLLHHSNVSTHFFIPQTTAKEFLNYFEACQDLWEDQELQKVIATWDIKHPNQTPIIQLVPCKAQAFHAGVSAWKNAQHFNTLSFGIELHAPGYAGYDGSNWHTYVTYPTNQLKSFVKLLHHLIQIFFYPQTKYPRAL